MSISTTATVATNIPLWIDFIRAISPIIAALIAGIVAWRFGAKQTEIAELQASTAKEKLKLDLYEKRVAVYETASRFIASALTHGNITAEDEKDFWKGIIPAQWLFSPEINKYLRQSLWKVMQDFRHVNEELKSELEQDARETLGLQRGLLFQKILAHQEELNKSMAPYLHFPQ